EPGRIGRTQTVITQNAYGEGPVSRLLTPLRGKVRPGNSGGPLVDSRGRVLTTVFAATVDGRERGGYGVAHPTVARVLRRRAGGRGARAWARCCGGCRIAVSDPWAPGRARPVESGRAPGSVLPC